VYVLYLLLCVCALKGAKERKKARLQNRLKYIVATYREGPYDNCWQGLARYWQFVTWARTIAIMVAPRLLMDMDALPQTIVPIAEVIVLIGLQYKCKPYPHRRQNRLELGGLVISLLTLILAIVYEVAGPMSTVVDILIIIAFILLWAVLGRFFVLRWVGEDGAEEMRSKVEPGDVHASVSTTAEAQGAPDAVKDVATASATNVAVAAPAPAPLPAEASETDKLTV